jgi:hypothetical protein
MRKRRLALDPLKETALWRGFHGIIKSNQGGYALRVPCQYLLT